MSRAFDAYFNQLMLENDEAYEAWLDKQQAESQKQQDEEHQQLEEKKKFYRDSATPQKFFQEYMMERGIQVFILGGVIIPSLEIMVLGVLLMFLDHLILLLVDN